MASTVKIVRWNADRGFGFVRLEDGREAFLHVADIEPRQPRGVDLRGSKVEIHRTTTGPKGLRAASATLAEETRQREAEKAARETDRRQLTEKFSRVRKAYPNGLDETAFNEACTVHLEAEEAQVLEIRTTWDSDAKEVSSRKGARSFQAFEWTRHQLVPRGIYPFDGPEGVFVRVEGNLKPGEELGNAPTGATLREAVPADSRWPDEYQISPEDAELLWQRCRWYLLPARKLQSAREGARQILEARRVWEQEFPGVTPGDRTGAILSTNLHTTSEGDWVWRRPWHVPPFLLIDEEEMWAERERWLRELTEAGDDRAREILAEESVDLFWEELIGGFERATGLGWDWDKMWSSDLHTDEDTVPVWAAFVGGEEVARLQIWYAKNGRPYYRLFDRDVCVPDSIFVPGSVEWRIIGNEPATR